MFFRKCRIFDYTLEFKQKLVMNLEIVFFDVKSSKNSKNSLKKVGTFSWSRAEIWSLILQINKSKLTLLRFRCCIVDEGCPTPLHSWYQWCELSTRTFAVGSFDHSTAINGFTLVKKFRQEFAGWNASAELWAERKLQAGRFFNKRHWILRWIRIFWLNTKNMQIYSKKC